MVNFFVISLWIVLVVEVVFIEFYYYYYIFKLLEVVFEIIIVCCYEEYGVVGSLKWFSKCLFMFYELVFNVFLEQINFVLFCLGWEEEIVIW